MNYYNENDRFAAAWLRELIKANQIAPGEVDERSIEDVFPNDLKGFIQCHFFAGIGGWSYALRLAGWPDDRPVWTGSCPCQPFSAAGKRKGTADERHLWPAWFHLISECKPSILFGEQVASKDGISWFDVVHADLEAANYAVGSADLCAACVSAPHIRQRLFWMAESESPRRCGRVSLETRNCKESGRSSSNVCTIAWPDGYGSKSSLRVPDVLSPSYGVPNRVGKLRGYGNAIVPQVAQAFIEAYLGR